MDKLKNINKFYIFLSLLLLIVPFYEIVISNFYILNLNHYLKLLKIFLVVFIMISTLSLILFKLDLFKELIFFKVTLFFWLNFYYLDITSFLVKYFVNYYSYIALISILILYIFFLIIFKKYKIFFSKFFTIFILLNLIHLSYQLFLALYNNQYDLDKITKSNMDNLITIKSKNPKNIYYIIVDEMISLESFEKVYSIKLDDYRDALNNTTGIYLKESSSIYNNTLLTASSIFNLDYISQETEIFYQASDISFPNLLIKKNFQNKNTNLLKILDILGYRFIWIDNSIQECFLFNKDLCLDTTKKTNFFFDQISQLVLNRTVFSSLIFKVKSNKKNTFERNNGLRRLMQYIAINQKILDNKNNFFFVHNFSTHSPFLYDQNCNFKKTNLLKKIDVKEGYKFSYLCTIDQILNFIKFIKKNDKDPIIVINADHGLRVNEGLDHDIFSYIYPRKCLNDSKLPLNQLDNIYFTINCVSTLNLNYKPSKKFEGLPMDTNGKFITKEIK